MCSTSDMRMIWHISSSYERLSVQQQASFHVNSMRVAHPFRDLKNVSEEQPLLKYSKFKLFMRPTGFLTLAIEKCYKVKASLERE